MIFGYLLFSLIVAPYLKNTNGIGSMSSATKPRRDVAHAIPKASYTVPSHLVSRVLKYAVAADAMRATWENLLCTVNKGNTAPNVYLDTPFAAIADAPLRAP